MDDHDRSNERRRLRLLTFGGLSVGQHPDDAAQTVVARRRSLMVLAVLAVAGDRGVSREKLCALFWPESGIERARNTLNQTIFTIRREFPRCELVRGTTEVWLDGGCISSDVGDFEAALKSRDNERVAALYTGPFLDGVHIRDASEFEHWVDAQRLRLAGAADVALHRLASAAEARDDSVAAIGWWRRIVELDPADGRGALGLMRAMASAGDSTGALNHARIYEAFVRAELGLQPDPTIVGLAAQLRASRCVTANTPPTIVDPVASVAPPVMPESDRERSVNPVSAARETGLTAAGQQITPTVLSHHNDAGSQRTVWLRTHLRSRHLLRIVFVACVLITSVIAWRIARSVGSGPNSALSDSQVVISPFHLAVSDSSLAYLREGIVDLLAAKLNGDAGPRAVDPAATIHAFRVAQSAESGELDHTAETRIAQSLGAGRLLTGSIVGTPARLVIDAMLTDVGNQHAGARASVAGPVDSLPRLIDRLAAQLLALDAGEAAPRLGTLMSTSLPALTDYLAGESAYRHGRYSDAVMHLGRALQADSNFALAGLALGLAAGWADRVPEKTRGVERAWAARNRLNARDRLFLRAFAGAGWPDSVASVAATRTVWDSVVAVLPDRPEVWYEYGDLLFHGGRATGDENSLERSAAAFRRALDLVPTFAPPVPHLVQILVNEGDTAGARRLTQNYLAHDSASEAAGFLRWLSAQATRDSASLRDLRRAMPTMTVPSLRWIILASEYDAMPTDDDERAANVLLARAVSTAQRAEALDFAHSVALNRGHPRDALAATEGMQELDVQSHAPLRLRVLDALYSVGDTTAAGSAAAALAGYVAPISTARDDFAELQSIRDACVLAQWRLASGDVSFVAHAVSLLRHTSLSNRTAGPTEAAGCVMLLQAQVALARRDAGAGDLVRRFDSLVVTGPPFPAMVPYAAIALARLYERLGDAPGALRASRLRFYMLAAPLPYLATALSLEGRNAAVVGDRNAAVRAYREYLALHASADPSVKSVDVPVRAAFARLTRH